MKQTAVYCGAFNPPTLAHKTIIGKVLALWDIDRIIFCPTGPREDKTYWITDQVREEILEIFCQEVNQSWLPIEISRYFYQDGKYRQTTTRGVDTYIQEKYWISPYHIFWYDIIEKIPSWSDNPGRLVEEQLKKIFISRPNFQANFSGYRNYRILDLWKENMEISSTLVRETLRTYWDISHLTTPDVCVFLQQNNIQYSI